MERAIRELSVGMDKLDMSLDDMVPKGGGKGKGGRGKGGAGGAIKAGRGAARMARAVAAPYQKPVAGRGRGKGGKGGATLADMAAAADETSAPSKPAFVLTTGTTLRVGNLDHGVSGEDIEGKPAGAACHATTNAPSAS